MNASDPFTSAQVQQIAVVTGSTSDIGEALCGLLLARGVHLLALDRNAARAQACHRRLHDAFPQARIDAYQADLADQASVQAVAERIRAQHAQVHFLFHNAGVLLGTLQHSAQGNEMHFEVNTLAPIALTHALREPLAAASHSAVVVSGSGARRMARHLKVSELRHPTRFQKMVGPYAQSKQAVFLAFAAMEAAFQIWGTQLHVVDLPPTRTATAHGDGMPAWLKPFGFLFASPQTSARRLLDAALQPPPGSAFLVGAPEAAHTAALLDTIHQAGLQTV